MFAAIQSNVKAITLALSLLSISIAQFLGDINKL